MREKSFFREAALSQVKYKNYGDVFVNIPLNYIVLVMGCGVIIIGIITFVIFGEFSEKCSVTGYLNAAHGVVRIYPKQRGIITKSAIKLGDLVKRGDVLFWIDTSYDELGLAYQSNLSKTLQKKQNSIQHEILQKTVQLKSLQPLLMKKYITLNAYLAKADEITALKNKKNELKIEQIKYNHSRHYPIRAPIDGVISSILYHVGQFTPISKPIAIILPQDAELIAELYIPVSQARFLTSKKNVLIHYDAYPYQQFGTAKGRIQMISQNTLTDNEEEKPLQIGQPYYKAIATLKQQVILHQGRSCSLRHGMTFSAVLIGHSKKIWQWILEPLYNHYRELKS
jgi:membrane fusion protein